VARKCNEGSRLLTTQNSQRRPSPGRSAAPTSDYRAGKLQYGLVRNATGVFVRASVAAVTSAASATEIDMPGDFRVSITNPTGYDAYPISTFTWLLVPSHSSEPAKRKALCKLLRWILTTGQSECASMGYAPLPKRIAARELKQIAMVR
jgi:phosphate transport system substrate-binding protein